MTYKWIDTLADLPQALVNADCWYMDTEFMRERTFWAELALVQVAADGELVLLDAPRLADSRPLGELLANKTLVLHACSEDLDVLAHTTGVAPQHIEDTQLAAALVGHPLQLSYQKLVELVCGITLPKDATRSDWLKRPLTAQQLDYAADDVRYLAEVRDQLVQQLAALGRLDWWHEECARLLQQVLAVTPSDDCWRQVKGVGNLVGRELARAQVLAAWRDGEARARNLPRSFVLKDVELLQVCQRAPTSQAQLASLDLAPGLIRRQGDKLLALLREAQDRPLPEPLPPPLDGEQKKAAKQLKQIAEQVAKEYELEVEVLIRRRWLESLVRNPSAILEPMSGWRKSVLTDRLLAGL